MEEYCTKKSGQIPAFGNWDYANELPITQYFECARQAGLIRYSSSSGDCAPYVHGDMYAVHFKKPSRTVPPTRKTIRKTEKQSSHVKERKAQGKVCDVTEPPRKTSQQLRHQDAAVTPRPLPLRAAARPPKPVDEDLYKIPPELLRTSKRKKMLRLLSKCLVPACAA
ncbi:hypothetical protein CJ030_MR3G027877 [Morella rubra]|uniref:RIN4 pathogenic type III effector avirulence factor Avr cleavage site domain-containing protein n=1 Tax=Morella rubra TaxID=262757 RepID=A0A6A1WAQ2_9ROSI|nr:hypothetical protein CJ030_MR3G027877 [Morella rubra]